MRKQEEFTAAFAINRRHWPAPRPPWYKRSLCEGKKGLLSIVAALLMLLPIASMSTTLKLNQVQSFAYIIGASANWPGIATLVANSPSQLVIAGGFGEATDTQFDRNNIDPTHSKIVLGYIDAYSGPT